MKMTEALRRVIKVDRYEAVTIGDLEKTLESLSQVQCGLPRSSGS